ncbi:hypothetical protein Tco_1196381 [Tanacetum coccineum]
MSGKTLRGEVTLSASSLGSSRCTTLFGTPSRSPRDTSWDGSWPQHFDLASNMRSKLWTNIEAGIEQHFAKVYADNKSYLKRSHLSVKPGETRDVECITGPTQWDRQIDFWLDPKHAVRAAQNA